MLSRALLLVLAVGASIPDLSAQIGREVAVPVHLQDGEEFTTPLPHRRLQLTPAVLETQVNHFSEPE